MCQFLLIFLSCWCSLVILMSTLVWFCVRMLVYFVGVNARLFFWIQCLSYFVMPIPVYDVYACSLCLSSVCLSSLSDDFACIYCADACLSLLFAAACLFFLCRCMLACFFVWRLIAWYSDACLFSMMLMLGILTLILACFICLTLACFSCADACLFSLFNACLFDILMLACFPWCWCLILPFYACRLFWCSCWFIFLMSSVCSCLLTILCG